MTLPKSKMRQREMAIPRASQYRIWPRRGFRKNACCGDNGPPGGSLLTAIEGRSRANLLAFSLPTRGHHVRRSCITEFAATLLLARDDLAGVRGGAGAR